MHPLAIVFEPACNRLLGEQALHRAGFRQRHPEWQAAHDPVSKRLLQAFGAAVRQHRDRVRGPIPG